MSRVRVSYGMVPASDDILTERSFRVGGIVAKILRLRGRTNVATYLELEVNATYCWRIAGAVRWRISTFSAAPARPSRLQVCG